MLHCLVMMTPACGPCRQELVPPRSGIGGEIHRLPDPGVVSAEAARPQEAGVSGALPGQDRHPRRHPHRSRAGRHVQTGQPTRKWRHQLLLERIVIS